MNIDTLKQAYTDLVQHQFRLLSIPQDEWEIFHEEEWEQGESELHQLEREISRRQNLEDW